MNNNNYKEKNDYKKQNSITVIKKYNKDSTKKQEKKTF